METSPDTARPLRIAYLMTWFPKLTETFVLDEIRVVERCGAVVEIFPLLRKKGEPVHPEALPLLLRTHFQPLFSFRIVAAHWHYIRRNPHTYSRTLAELLRGSVGSLRCLIGALAFFPKAVLFARQMEHLDIDHIHAHFASNPALSAWIIHRLTGIPYSFTAHGSDLHVDRTLLDEKVRAAAFAVTVSSYNREVMVGACGEPMRGKIHVVRSGVDVAALQPKTDWCKDGPLEILCVASLGEVKGHTYLVDACRILAKRGIDFRCHLVGEGPLRPRITRQIAAAALTGRFQIHGGLARPQVERRLRQADLFVLPSVPTPEGRREGIPVALMEAMACALPVVASDLSGIPELVEHNVCGQLVPPRDSIGLANAIKRYHDNPRLREAMGQAARKKVVDRFDLKKSAGRLVEHFEHHAAAGIGKESRCESP
jgi:glycosyltransferase involved in cell wall biosynthesis